MNKEWTEFLDTRTNTAQNSVAPNCALNDLSHLGLIRISGEDAETYLQGQLTNDVRKVTNQHSNLAGWCNAKGRMLANFRCFRRADDYFLQTPLENVPSVMQRQGMYVLRAKVTLSDVSDELIRIGLTGDCSDALLQPFFEDVPEQPNDVMQQGELTLIHLPGSKPRFEVIGPANLLQEIWQTAEGQAQTGNRDFWALQEIRAGIPTIYQETKEAFVPQMTNMQLIDGVSFTKGCYTGQEVVARMQYLGKLKRRMYLAHVDTSTEPQPGDELYAKQSTSGQGTGKVVEAQANGDGYDLLAVIEIASAEEGQVLLGEQGPALEILNLPYPFSE
ncbi:MAG: folate-binding protein YgfZ [Candidatus Thiodiazotropha sp. 6PLUC3]